MAVGDDAKFVKGGTVEEGAELVGGSGDRGGTTSVGATGACGGGAAAAAGCALFTVDRGVVDRKTGVRQIGPTAIERFYVGEEVDGRHSQVCCR